MTRPRLGALLAKPSTWVVPYVALWAIVGLLPIQPTDLDIFFWPSAKVAVEGHPLLVYSASGQDAYPNANGPVALLPLSLVGLVAHALGWLDSMHERRAMALAVFSLFVLLMAREAVNAIERLRGSRLSPYPRLLLAAVLALSPPVWQSVAGYGHIEQPIEIWLLLVAARLLQADRTLTAGLAFGLALLSRSPAVMQSIPFALASWQHGPRRFALLFATTGVTGAAVLLPFLLADPADVIHSLFTYRGGLPVGAGSVWSLTHGGGLQPVVQHWDVAAIAAVVIAANLWLASRPGLDETRLFAGMTLTAACFALLAKTVWPYYFFEVFVFGTVWAAGRWRADETPLRLVLPPIILSALGMVAEVGSAQGLPDVAIEIEGVGMFAMLGMTALWMLGVASLPPPDEAGMGDAPATFQGHGAGAGDRHEGTR